MAFRLMAVAIALIMLFNGCAKNHAQDQGTKPKPSFSTDLSELRQRFNGDKGKVRLLLILSPT